MLLPSAVHVSSIIKREASGDWETRYSVVFRICSVAKYVYMYIIFVVLVSSIFEFGAEFHDCLIEDPQGNPPFPPLFRCPMNVIA